MNGFLLFFMLSVHQLPLDFNLLIFPQVSTYGKILLIVLMLIGGTAFSTTGGIKIARLILIFQKLINYKENRTTLNDYNNLK